MPYFFCDKNLKPGAIFEITGDEARHVLLAHRAKKGEKIKVQGPDGKRYWAEILGALGNAVSLKPLEAIAVPNQPLVAITLFQALVSEKALDFIFQKGTELGLNKIILFNSQNTAVKLSPQGFEKKSRRWGKILLEAAKQSERAQWPGLEFIPQWPAVLFELSKLEKIYLAEPSGPRLKIAPRESSSLAYIVGPEGGFTQAEISSFKSLPNLQSFSLGPVLLRAETAALAALAVLRNLLD